MSMGMDLPPDPAGKMGGEMQERLLEEAQQVRQEKELEEIHRRNATEDGTTVPKHPWWKFWG